MTLPSNARPIPLHSNNTASPSRTSSGSFCTPPARGAGLSNRHISPQGRKTLTVARGGRWAKLQNPDAAAPPPKDARRGICRSFTARSRSRLIQTFARIWREKCPPLISFITLTYPGEYSADRRVWHRDMDAFGKAWRRRYPRSFFIWRLEAQKRGAPHFHLISWSWGGRDIKWLSDTWYRVVGSGDERHRRAGTQWERVESWRQAQNYTSKYQAKLPEAEEWAESGRWWSVVGRKEMPVTEITIELSDWEFWRIRRLMRRQMNKKNGYHQDGGSRSGCWVGWSEDTPKRVLAYLTDLQRSLEGRNPERPL